MKKLLIAVLVMSGLAAFQGTGYPEPPGPGEESTPSPEQFKKVRERIQTLRMWKLTEALDLDEATAAKLFPILKESDGQRFEAEKALREDMRKLSSQADTMDEKVLRELISRVENGQRKLQQLNESEMGKIKGVLSVRQQAKYITFMHRFERNMRERLAGARRGRHKGGMRQMQEGPDTERGRPPMERFGGGPRNEGMRGFPPR